VILPHLERAVVPKEKLTEYLLSDTHPDGAPKAAFFHRFGFTSDNWHGLAEALLKHAGKHAIVKEETTPFGVRYTIEGPVDAADGRRPNLRSVWFIDMGTDTPCLVTAYPLKGEADDQRT